MTEKQQGITKGQFLAATEQASEFVPVKVNGQHVQNVAMSRNAAGDLEIDLQSEAQPEGPAQEVPDMPPPTDPPPAPVVDKTDELDARTGEGQQQPEPTPSAVDASEPHQPVEPL